MTVHNLPLEASLAVDVRNCRACSWFWQGTPPYGPFPSYDWLCDFPPQALATGPQPAPRNAPEPPRRWLEGCFVKSRLVEPGVMHGCRMAPIMTVGINPNMTAWFPAVSAAGWCYPAFSNDARYAYYYRHFTLYQESVALAEVRNGLDAVERIVAEDDGWLIGATRGNAHNYMELSVQYRSRSAPTVYEIAFAPAARWVIVQSAGKEREPGTWFAKGAVLAGRFEPQEGARVELFENVAGYYQRMIPVLQRFAAKCGLTGAKLTVGEDVAQHDMVSCASPGWQDKYDMPMATLARHCVSERGWFVAQFVQSQPKVVILVGSAALAMFRSVFAPFMTLENTGRDIYQLLDETCTRPTYVSIDIGAVKFRTRLIATPHFSYAENFLAQARLSALAWEAFQADFAVDVEVLTTENRIYKASAGGVIPVALSGADDPIRQRLSVNGWQVLSAYYMDPFDLVAGALAAEMQAGTLSYDQASGHLSRSDGPCHFCSNGLWQFPEGCAYGKTGQAAYPPDTLEAVVREILGSHER